MIKETIEYKYECVECGFKWVSKERLINPDCLCCYNKRKEIQPLTYPYFMPPIQYGNVPSCCVRCSNHPSNGGSGVCNCTAPDMLRWNSGDYYGTC